MAWTNPRTWVAGEKPSAGTFNTHIRDNFDAIGDPWTAYTPTWTASTDPSLGNGTKTGHYIQAGALIFFRIRIVFGSTTTAGSGTYVFGLPPFAALFNRLPAGTSIAYDTSASTVKMGGVFLNTTSTCSTRDYSDAPYTAAYFTWATGDEICLQGFYEAA